MNLVIGAGSIADRFCDFSNQEQFVIFAGTIEDSQISDIELINKEEKQIKDALMSFPDAVFVYFSSCSVNDPTLISTRYVQHKMEMESLVRNSRKSFYIFRLPSVVNGSSKENDLVSYFVRSIANQLPFELWSNTTRNIIDIDDVHEIVVYILKNSLFMNSVTEIVSPLEASLRDLVFEIEDVIGKKAIVSEVLKGATYRLDHSKIAEVVEQLGMTFDQGYVHRTVEKHFGFLAGTAKKLSIVVPTYNEELGIDEFYKRTKKVLNILSPRFEHEIIFVNDYSTDKTQEKLDLLADADSTVKVIRFSRNFGNQAGISAGLDVCSGDAVVVIDDDLQDPPEVILDFVAKWESGFKVVYGIRSKRKSINRVFGFLAWCFYRILGTLSETKIPNDTGDFRLVDKIVVEHLKSMKERDRYMRGLVAWVGFKQVGVYYERDRRYAGVSSFSPRKYLKFALSGITAFSERPLYVASYLGLFTTSLSFLVSVYVIVSKLIDPASVTIGGWTSLIVISLFFGGIQLLAIGILGIYLGRVFNQIKARPLYLVEDSRNL
jgi:dolichol-phosphate mannosyltransferase